VTAARAAGIDAWRDLLAFLAAHARV